MFSSRFQGLLTPLFALLFIGFALSCAKQTTPEGGPFDMVPPRLVKANPPNHSTHVTTNKIKLTFNENVTLERQSEKVLISPPQRTPPQFTSGTGRSITILFEDSLRSNTTYTIDFSDAIVDLNERNPLEGFVYTFSTGEQIDSMQLRGLVLDARHLYPMPNLAVGVFTDSLPNDINGRLFERMGLTTERGEFTIPALAPGRYALYALDDIDKSRSFSSPAEGLGWLDTLVSAEPFIPEVFDLAAPADTMTRVVEQRVESSPEHGVEIVDSLVVKTDSLNASDTISIPQGTTIGEEMAITSATPERPSLLLLYARPAQRGQKMLKAARPDSVRIQVQFAEPLQTLPPLQLEGAPDSPLPGDISLDRMEAIYWLLDSTIARRDTLMGTISYPTLDSLEQPILQTDSLRLLYRRPLPPKATLSKKKKLAEQTEVTDSLATAQSTAPIRPLELVQEIADSLHIGAATQPVYIRVGEPLSGIDTSRIHLYRLVVAPSALDRESVPSSPLPPSSMEQAEEPPYTGSANPYDTPTQENAAPDNAPKATDTLTTEEKELPIEEIPREAVPFEIQQVPHAALRYEVLFERDFGQQYILAVDSAALEGHYGAIIPATELPLTFYNAESFANLEMVISHEWTASTAAYVELLDAEDRILLTLPMADTLHINELTPATYFARIWIDTNGNGCWDAGKYPSEQAEPLYYCPTPLEAKPKFINSILWKVNDRPLWQQRPPQMKRPQYTSKEEQRRERRNLNEEYIQRMRERYGDKWNPSNRDRKLLGLPSRQEEKARRQAEKQVQKAQETSN